MNAQIILGLLKPLLSITIKKYLSYVKFKKCFVSSGERVLDESVTGDSNNTELFKAMFGNENMKFVASYCYEQTPLDFLLKIKLFIKQRMIDLGFAFNDEDIDNQLNYFADCLMESFRINQTLIYVLIKQDSIQEAVDKQENEIQTLYEELDSALAKLNSSKSFSVNAVDINLRANRKDILISLDTFDFKDSKFDKDLSDNLILKENEVIRICGAYEKETFYATLCSLKRILGENYNDRIFIFNSKNDLENCDLDFPENSIVINNFYDDDIKIIDDVTNIHIVSNIESNACDITLQKRLYRSLFDQLKAEGNDSDTCFEAMQKSKNCFPTFFRRYFKYDSMVAKRWANAMNGQEFIQVAMLLNGWCELDNCYDKKIIKKLSGISYEKFISILTNPKIDDEPFLVKRLEQNIVSYELSSEEETWLRFAKIIRNDLSSKFFDIAKNVLSTLPNSYKTDGDYKFNNPYKEKYSSSLREGILKTLALIPMYLPNKQKECEDVLIYVLGKYNNPRYIEYCSKLLEHFVEVSPKIVCDYLLKCIEEKKSFYALFEDSKTKKYDLLDTQNYIYVLFAIEKLAFFNETKKDCIRILFNLFALDLEYGTSNSPLDMLKIFLNIYSKTCALEINEKIELIKEFLVKDDYHAKLLIRNLVFNGIGPMWIVPSKTKIIKTDFERDETYTDKEIFYMNDQYCYELLKADSNVEDLCFYIKNSTFLYCSKGLKDNYVEVLKKYINDMSDKDKILIDKSLRSFIYDQRKFENRRFRNDEIISIYEELLNNLNYSRKEYRIIYALLFRLDNVPILNPQPFEKSNAEIFDLEEKEVKETMDNFFEDNNLDIYFICEFFKDNPDFKLSNPIFFNEFFKLIKNNFKSNKDVFYEIAKNINSISSNIPNFGYSMMEIDKNAYIELLKTLKKENNIALLTYLITCISFRDTSPDVYKAFFDFDEDMQNIYWSNVDYCVIDSKNKDIYETALKELLINKNISAYCQLIESIYYGRNNLFSQREIVDAIWSINIEDYRKVNNKSIISEIICGLEETLRDETDEEYIQKMATIELLYLPEYKSSGDRRVFLYDELSKDPSLFLTVIMSRFRYPNDDAFNSKMFVFGFRLKFCPGFINKKFDNRIFKSWVEKYTEAITKENQVDYGYLYLGKLLAFSEKDANDLMSPVKEIREYVESLNDANAENVCKGFANAKYNSRGMKNVDAGEGSLLLSKQEEEIANKLEEQGYKKISNAYRMLSKTDKEEAKYSRERAQNEY